MSTKDLILYIEHRDITGPQLAAGLLDPRHFDNFAIYFESLCAIAEANQIYSQLPGARVDLQVTSSPLSKSRWWRTFSKRIPRPGTRVLRDVFSCIALFETGFLDVDPAAIGEETIAVSNANSIFVASELLLDPSAPVPPVPIERITGNIGKPGFAFLVTPPNPKVRGIDHQSWNLIAHEPFDGKCQDNFGSTSLHLSFTGYELPLDVGQRGVREAPALFIETAVSVYDRGEWIADPDIMKSCKSLVGKRQWGPCAHSEDQKSDMAPFMPIVSVDSWLELLDQPLSNSVVRACGNAMARLATAALAAQQGRKTLVMSEEPCWWCLKSQAESAMNQVQTENAESSSGFDDPEDAGDSESTGGSESMGDFEESEATDCEAFIRRSRHSFTLFSERDSASEVVDTTDLPMTLIY